MKNGKTDLGLFGYRASMDYKWGRTRRGPELWLNKRESLWIEMVN